MQRIGVLGTLPTGVPKHRHYIAEWNSNHQTTSALTTEGKANAEVLTHSYLDCLGDGLRAFHLQGAGT
jgi:hypothetical protein